VEEEQDKKTTPLHAHAPPLSRGLPLKDRAAYSASREDKVGQASAASDNQLKCRKRQPIPVCAKPLAGTPMRVPSATAMRVLAEYEFKDQSRIQAAGCPCINQQPVITADRIHK